MLLRALSISTVLVTALSIAGCGTDDTASGTNTSTNTAGSGGAGTGGTATGTGMGGEPVIGGDRPVTMYIPEQYDGSKPAPLLVLLHGYGASGLLQEIYFQLDTFAEERGYIYAVPDGTLDATNKRFWNATDACCGFGATVDDSGYLAGVVDEIKAAYNIDPKRVYFAGHSNGAFMSYRMACDHADQIAAIVGLAGATWGDDSKCNPSEPVAVAHIHGTDDADVLYTGGANGPYPFPGAGESAQIWAAHDGCNLEPAPGPALDLEIDIAGDETNVQVYGTACKPGGHVELWTIEGGSHLPALTEEFRTSLFDFLDAHPKP